ncbi:hypothetical protein DFH09DRAFT_1300370 [Mycena vulgaris]|nr:hypothetical protein DFH09DRAFT_1300370 [Mycena vulgaris]
MYMKRKGGKGGRKELRLRTSHPAPARACRRRAARIVIPIRVLHDTQLASDPAPASSPLIPLTTVPGHVRSADPRAGKHDATPRTYPSPHARQTRASQDRRRRCTHSNLPALRVCICAAPTTCRKTVVTGRKSPASASPPGNPTLGAHGRRGPRPRGARLPAIHLQRMHERRGLLMLRTQASHPRGEGADEKGGEQEGSGSAERGETKDGGSRGT